eukprot:786884-Pyramimonas_sp.AAC.1
MPTANATPLWICCASGSPTAKLHAEGANGYLIDEASWRASAMHPARVLAWARIATAAAARALPSIRSP